MISWSRKEKTTTIAVVAILALSAFLRIHGIGTKDIWLDEANTVLISEKGPSDMVWHLGQDQSPPLYYAILHCWMKVFGQNEIAVRMLSAIFGVLLVGALFLVGQRLLGTKTGFFAALIGMVAPIQVMYSQQVRMYSLLPLASVVSIYFIIQLVRKGGNRQVFGYGLSTIACLYTHNYGFLMLPAQALVVLVFGLKRKIVIRWLLGIGVVFLGYLPWLLIFVGQVKNIPTGSWRQGVWDAYGFWGSLYGSLQSFSPGGTLPPYVPLNGVSWGPTLPMILLGTLLLLGLKPLFQTWQVSAKSKMAIISIFICGIVPLISAGMVSLAVSPIYLPGRCDQLVFPAFCLLAAVGLRTVNQRVVRYGLLIVVLGFSLKTLDEYYRSNLKAGDKEIALRISEALKPGDAILCTSVTRASLEYYLRDTSSLVQFWSYPMENADHLGHQFSDKLLKQPEKLMREVSLLDRRIKEGRIPSGRLFVVYVPNRVNRFLGEYLKRNWSPAQKKVIGRFRQSVTKIPVEVVLIVL